MQQSCVYNFKNEKIKLMFEKSYVYNIFQKIVYICCMYKFRTRITVKV
jgi:hypothetical protein